MPSKMSLKPHAAAEMTADVSAKKVVSLSLVGLNHRQAATL
jgi:hypothetical protein